MNAANEVVPRAHREIKLTPVEEARFWKKVDKTGGAGACWPWTAGSDRHGYGYFSLLGQTKKAPRVAWVLTHGQIAHDGSYHGGCVMSNIYHEWASEHMPDASKEIEDLTDDEKMAVYILAGVPVRRVNERVIITSVTCGMVKDGGKFRVFQNKPQHGTRLIFKPESPPHRPADTGSL